MMYIEDVQYMLREEEINWFQRAKTRDFLQEDSNTKYFKMVTNGKRRKTRIFRLEQEEGVIEGEENLRKYIKNYYKSRFGDIEVNKLFLDESVKEDITHVAKEENRLLIEEFTEKEVRDAIFQMKHNKAPGPDGFPAEFYQVFWSLIKEDVIAMFRYFHKGKLDLFSLNFGVITLLPKL